MANFNAQESSPKFIWINEYPLKGNHDRKAHIIGNVVGKVHIDYGRKRPHNRYVAEKIT